MKNLLFILIVTALFSCKKEDVQSEPIEGLQVITSLSQMTSELESGVSMVFFTPVGVAFVRLSDPQLAK